MMVNNRIRKAAYALIIVAFLVLQATTGYSQSAADKWEKDIENFERSDKTNGIKYGSILFTGSSSITKWPDINTYFPSYDILNRGFGGSQFSDLLAYVDRVIVAYKPSKVFIYEGDNDIAAGETPEQVFEEAVKLREILKSKLPGVPVVFISAKPSIARWNLKDRYVQFNRLLKKYADETELTMYADVWTPMLEREGNVKQVFLKDDLHMTAEGYKIWQQALMKFLPASKKD